MTIELVPPVEHGATHDVELVIQGLPVDAIFCSRMFVALKLSDEQAKHLCEELNDWLRTK